MSNEFIKSAKSMSKSPLGIIGLFLVFVYVMSGVVAGFGFIPEWLRVLLVIYLMLFPLLILYLFYNLVIKHSDKLYAPQDFRDDSTFLEVMKLRINKSNYKVTTIENDVQNIVTKIESNINMDQIKSEIMKSTLKPLLFQYGSLTLKVLYYSLENRVDFKFSEDSNLVMTVFDGIQQGGYIYQTFYEEFMDLHEKQLITMTSVKPVEFKVAEFIKPVIKEIYENDYELNHENVLPRAKVKRVIEKSFNT